MRSALQALDFSDSSLEREPLYLQVADRVLKHIIVSELPVDTRLPSERKLSEQFGVSRVVIREAMKVLVRNGMVVVKPGHGTFTSDRTHDSLAQSLDLLFRVQGLNDENLLEVRAPLEIVIAGLAALRADQEDIALLKSCIDEMESSIKDIERHVAADERFHLALATASDNELFEGLIQPIVFLLKEARKTMAKSPGVADRALEHHRRLLEAIKGKDAFRAESEMRRHMEQVEGDLAAARAGGKASADLYSSPSTSSKKGGRL